VVVAWQQALIAHHVISDIAANRDGIYGKGMAGAVRRLQRSWGWSNADGVAGAHTWSRLHGGP
jgi:peptidoglycan hydrolase-like protein with peptidoglycan-binding domain